MSLAIIAAILLVAPRALGAVSIYDDVLSWLRGEWAALAQERHVPEAFPERSFESTTKIMA